MSTRGIIAATRLRSSTSEAPGVGQLDPVDEVAQAGRGRRPQPERTVDVQPVPAGSGLPGIGLVREFHGQPDDLVVVPTAHKVIHAAADATAAAAPAAQRRARPR